MLGLLDAFDDVLVEPLLPDSAVVTLDIGVLLRLAGLDMLDGYSQFLGPDQKLATDVFWAVINPSGWLAAPLDDAFQAANDPFCGLRKVHLDPKPLAVEVIQHVERPELAAICQSVSHKIHRPGDIRCIRHRQNIRLLPFQPLSRLDPQVQFQLASDTIDAFVVPRMALHVARVQKTPAKPPSFAAIRQVCQKIGHLIILRP